MSETPRPTVVIEGRAPLPGQLVTRQTYLSSTLAAEDIQTFFVNFQDSEAYDSAGRLRNLDLEPGQYAWRLRDATWQHGDPLAYPPGSGYNSATARTDLATREGFAKTLRALGLERYGVPLQRVSDLKDREVGEFVFVKPNRVNDISGDAASRARLVKTAGLIASIVETEEDTILQQPEKLLNTEELVDQLGAVASIDRDVNYLHALRVFTPLWLLVYQTPAIELRLTATEGDIGKQFATQLQLLEPELVFNRLPEIAKVHDLVRNAFTARYGEHNYLAFDYIMRHDGSVKILNGLVRAMTPNLTGQTAEVQHLANATADVEVKRLAKLAIDLAEY